MAAKALAVLFCPPPTLASAPLALFWKPPLTLALKALAMFLLPPLTLAFVPLAKFSRPPLTLAPLTLALRAVGFKGRLEPRQPILGFCTRQGGGYALRVGQMSGSHGSRRAQEPFIVRHILVGAILVESV